MAVSDMPKSSITVGRTNVIPNPPMPWVTQISVNGMKVGFLNRDAISLKSKAFEDMDGC